MEKSLGVCLDQKIGDKYTPLTEYYFWPRTDAWEELRIDLELKSWMSQSEVFLLLNQVTEVINYWQEKSEFSRKKELYNAKERFSNCLFIGHD